jgi:hypothetical protein
MQHTFRLFDYITSLPIQDAYWKATKKRVKADRKNERAILLKGFAFIGMILLVGHSHVTLPSYASLVCADTENTGVLDRPKWLALMKVPPFHQGPIFG